MGNNDDKLKKEKGTRNDTNTTEGFETKDRSDLSKNRQVLFTRKVKNYKTPPDAAAAQSVMFILNGKL